MLISILRKYFPIETRRGCSIGLFAVLLFLLWTPVYCVADSGVDALFTDSFYVSGWKIDGKVYRYVPDNLYEYIDGGAYFFIGYGFVELTGANFSSNALEDDAITVDVYDMGTKLNAFGVYRLRRDDQAPSLGIGTASFGSDDYLVFHKDRFYVEIRALLAAPKDRNVLAEIASTLAERLPGEMSLPQELAYLPEKNKIMGSERFIKGGILGHEFLDQGLVCDYHIEGKQITAFIAFLSSAEEAANSLQQHKKFLEQAKKKWRPLEGFDANGFVSEEPYHQKIMVTRQERYIIGIYDLDDLASGKTLLADIVNRLQQ